MGTGHEVEAIHVLGQHRHRAVHRFEPGDGVVAGVGMGIAAACLDLREVVPGDVRALFEHGAGERLFDGQADIGQAPSYNPPTPR